MELSHLGGPEVSHPAHAESGLGRSLDGLLNVVFPTQFLVKNHSQQLGGGRCLDGLALHGDGPFAQVPLPSRQMDQFSFLRREARPRSPAKIVIDIRRCSSLGVDRLIH